MAQSGSRPAFERLLTRSHVERALIDGAGQHNPIPLALGTVALLNGTAPQLESVYGGGNSRFPAWNLSPGRILSEDDVRRHMGDAKYQRAFVDYFSLQYGRSQAICSQWLQQQLFMPLDTPLFHGLFGELGEPLLHLSHAFELESSILLVESLVLAALDVDTIISEVLSDPGLSEVVTNHLPPDAIMSRLAHDGRFSGVVKSGPGYEQVALVLSNSMARSAIIEYVQLLDLDNIPELLGQLADLSAALLCGTHKRDTPAFDLYLSSLPSLVQALRVLLPLFADKASRMALARGVWLLMLLAYITQMRPVIDRSLVSTFPVNVENLSWERLWSEFCGQSGGLEGKYLDPAVIHSLRSLQQLGKASPDKEAYFLLAAWKLRLQWRQWIGRGRPGEGFLNVRL